MTVRRLNFTGRHRIRREDVVITISVHDGGTPSFSVLLDLKDYNLPNDALVSVEAYRRTWIQRHHLGHAGAVSASEHGPFILDGLQDAAGVKFRVKVSAEKASDLRGQLLAGADRLVPTASPDTPQEVVSLLPVGEADLGELVWRVDCDAATSPVLQVSRELGRGIARTPYFHALVFPSALQQILDAARLIGGRPDDVDEDDWRLDWLHLGLGLAGPWPTSPMDHEDWDDWCKDVVSRFAARHSLQRRYADWFEGGER